MSTDAYEHWKAGRAQFQRRSPQFRPLAWQDKTATDDLTHRTAQEGMP
ncbi:hypothetical protein [Streptomyces sp. TP-A0356]|nr:hypothetical protein [Streptomyces sp. TP-A0356]